jgi:hypothetical protein
MVLCGKLPQGARITKIFDSANIYLPHGKRCGKNLSCDGKKAPPQHNVGGSLAIH